MSNPQESVSSYFFAGFQFCIQYYSDIQHVQFASGGASRSLFLNFACKIINAMLFCLVFTVTGTVLIKLENFLKLSNEPMTYPELSVSRSKGLASARARLDKHQRPVTWCPWYDKWQWNSTEKLLAFEHLRAAELCLSIGEPICIIHKKPN